MEKPNDPWTLPSGAKIKAWFIMRQDVPMSVAKFGVQIGHATDMIHIHGAANPYHAAWLDPTIGNRRKIVLRAKSLSDLAKVKVVCDTHGLLTHWIDDAGLTEFGQPTRTGLVVLPHDDSLVPKVLSRAQSWKDE